MQERKYRAIGWKVSEKGQRFERLLPGLGFLFREGDLFPVSPFMQDYAEAVKAIKTRREQLKSFGKGGTVVFDVESNALQEYLDQLEF